jgi:hypothetical protein
MHEPLTKEQTMLKLQRTIDEAQGRVGSLESLISDKGFSPPVHDQPLDISILSGRGTGPTQGKARQQSSEAAGLDGTRRVPATLASEFSRIPLPGIRARWEAVIDADQAGAAAPASNETRTTENNPPARKPQLCGFDTVRPCDTLWIWPGRVAKGWLTLLAGEAASGKSLVLIDLVSRASRGDAFPRGREPGASGFSLDAASADQANTDHARAGEADIPKAKNVLLLVREGAEGVVQPRLAAAGADMRRIQTLRDFPDNDERGQPVTRGFDIEKDLRAVEETLADQPAIELIVIDGCALALDSRHRGFSETSLATLRALHELARRRNVAIVVAVSIEGQAAGHGLRRWLEKLLAITEDRFVLAMIRDRRRPARRFLLTLRAALEATDEGLRFETSAGRIVWGDAAVSAAALGASAGQLDQMDAALWLRRELAFYPRAVTELREAAQEAGFAWHVVCRAKAIAGVDGRREGWGPNGRYFWFLERDGEERPEDEGFWEDLADGTDRSKRADWDYQQQSADGAEGAYHEEMARLSKLTKAMAAEPDVSAPLVTSLGSHGSGAEQVESNGRAVEGEVLTPQKAAEITMENKKTPQSFLSPAGSPNDGGKVGCGMWVEGSNVGILR